ncbi:MAG: histone-like nucleoid-structuring protein Lsr2 [Microbacterium gubbeenense]|uniref:histone-like nucleoid-structuring protein Lsr2 n=1 Tax=Microbacterium gubbeenense TaxID=159896 RepID=UPI003F97F6C1
MATKTIRVDDLDGSEGAELHSFALDGQVFDIDLTDENFQALRSALEPFLDVASPQKRITNKPADTRAVRSWAEEKGLLKEGSSGRIPVVVMAEYRKSHRG